MSAMTGSYLTWHEKYRIGHTESGQIGQTEPNRLNRTKSGRIGRKRGIADDSRAPDGTDSVAQPAKPVVSRSINQPIRPKITRPQTGHQ